MAEQYRKAKSIPCAQRMLFYSCTIRIAGSRFAAERAYTYNEDMQFFLLAAVLLFAAYFYGRWMEPNQLEVTRHVVSSHKVHRPIHIVQFSDLHMQRSFPKKRLDTLAREINALHPDIIVFTGDLYDSVRFYKKEEPVCSFLASLHAPYKFAVLGNHDYYHNGQSYVYKILRKGGFSVLKDAGCRIELKGQSVYITGYDDLAKCQFHQKKQSSPSLFSLLLCHEPDGAFLPTGLQYDLALAGHSHGGQINLFWIPGIQKLSIVKGHNMGYLSGFYGKLYVNRGIGMTHIPLRIGARPEITSIQIISKRSEHV